MYINIYIFHYKDARLVLTLRYLATGDNLHSLAYAFRTGYSTAPKIVKEVSITIFEALSPEYLKEPKTAQWKIIALEFTVLVLLLSSALVPVGSSVIFKTINIEGLLLRTCLKVKEDVSQ